MSVSTRFVTMLVGVVAIAGACFTSPTTFICGDSSVCQLGGSNGTCEPTGFCSFSDSACPTGRRYGEFASHELAGSCVVDPDGIACDDGLDNDHDGLIDLGDPGCSGPADGGEKGDVICDNGLDDDGDGKIDFQFDGTGDPGCTSASDDLESGATACDDGLDNDNDGLADAVDPGCDNTADASEYGTIACDDGIDNDGDGVLDSVSGAGDPGCEGPTDADEHGTAICDDGLDNDMDGIRDFTIAGGDVGCSDLADVSERGTSECDNGIDDDGDGRSDVSTNLLVTDPGCSDAADASEKGTTTCDDGVDNDGDGRVDFTLDPTTTDPGCADPTDVDEKCVAGAGCPECDDAIDNDGDTRIDLGDPGCVAPDMTAEAALPPCSDGIDNDGDGMTDFPSDTGCNDGDDSNERGVVVSEVSPFARKGGGCVSTDHDVEFIELYNPGPSSKLIGGFRIETYRQGAWSVQATLPMGTVIAPRRFYLLGTAGYATSVCDPGPVPDATLGIGLEATNGGARLVTATGLVVDALAYGTGVPGEGTPRSWSGTGGLVTMERKANASSTAASMETGADAMAGNAYDTNNNATDFVIRAVRAPQNAASPAEP